MADHGIMFSAPMIRALLAGAKTQTRRIIKLPIEPTFRGGWEATTIGGPGCTTSKGVPVPEQPAIWNPTTGTIIGAPYGVVGNRIWVREALELVDVLCGPRGESAVNYVADGSPCPYVTSWPWKGGKLSPRFMPRGARRMDILITDLRVQRLHDVSEDDAVAESVRPLESQDGIEQSAREMYALAWDEINGEKSWASNPFVWARTFTVEERKDG